MRGSASEPALSVAPTREEVKKVQIVRWECVNEDAPVAQERLTHRGATYLAFTKPRMTVYGETVLREPGTSPLLTSIKNVPVVDRRASLGTYFSFVKPHIDATFVLVGVTGSLLARMRSGSLPPGRLLGVVAAIALLSAGAECWTNLVDRDIDAVMRRTARRSLPAGAISVRGASIVGTVLTVAGLGTAASLGVLPFLFLTFALINNVVVYSLLTKRSTPWSIVLGAAVGPLTLWAGYTAISVPMSMAAVLLGAMVAAWVPVHIWAIATRYRDDYARAGVSHGPGRLEFEPTRDLPPDLHAGDGCVRDGGSRLYQDPHRSDCWDRRAALGVRSCSGSLSSLARGIGPTPNQAYYCLPRHRPRRGDRVGAVTLVVMA